MRDGDGIDVTEIPVIAFLGAGSMARAILDGILRSTVPALVRTTNRSAARADELAADGRVEAFSTERDPDANRRAVSGARVVVIAVKPNMVRDLLMEIAGALEPGTLVLSVVAGVTSATFESLLPSSVAVIRTMPNTPAVVGHAVTGVARGARTNDADLALAVALFESVGEVLVVPESMLDALSTISGSGPAYVYFLIEQLEAAAVGMGFTPAQAATMVRGTFRGASELLATSGEEPRELRRRVTSPNGTTERAIAVLEDAGIGETFTRATDAALARAHELAAQA